MVLTRWGSVCYNEVDAEFRLTEIGRKEFEKSG